MEEYTKVEIAKYVKQGLESGTMIPREAEKFARIIAKQGLEGEKVISWSVDAQGNELVEKEAKVEIDKETNQPGWIATKVDENGNVIVDNNNHPNQWIIDDKTFRKKYEIDPENPTLCRPKGGPQIFVQITDNIILNQWGSDMQIAAGGYINITNVDDMYGISKRDFEDTYKFTNNNTITKIPLMNEVDFIRFFVESRANRILFEEKNNRYFEQYPDRKEMIEESNRSEIESNLDKHPEWINILKQIEIIAKQQKQQNIENGQESLADSDEFMIKDVEYIFGYYHHEKNTDISQKIDKNQYEVIKILAEARCVAYRNGVLEGGKHIIDVLEIIDPEIIEEAKKLAPEVDKCKYPARSISDDLNTQLFRVENSTVKKAK